jgi:hypothetical protein
MKLIMQERRIDKLIDGGDLNTREESFLRSLKNFIRIKGRLSNKQWSAFQKVEYRHSPAFMEDKKAWISNWDDDKARKVRVAAEYYSHNKPWYQDLSEAILADKEYIPSEKDYNKLVENKYVQNVLSMLAADPLYPVGSLVKIRSVATVPRKLRNRIAFVVSNSGVIKSATRGSRPYKILPFGYSNTIEMSECRLKKKR